jgi:hypothetical protein
VCVCVCVCVCACARVCVCACSTNVQHQLVHTRTNNVLQDSITGTHSFILSTSPTGYSFHSPTARSQDEQQAIQHEQRKNKKGDKKERKTQFEIQQLAEEEAKDHEVVKTMKRLERARITPTAVYSAEVNLLPRGRQASGVLSLAFANGDLLWTASCVASLDKAILDQLWPAVWPVLRKQPCLAVKRQLCDKYAASFDQLWDAASVSLVQPRHAVVNCTANADTDSSVRFLAVSHEAPLSVA